MSMTFSSSSAWISAHAQVSICARPGARRAYSSQGGSTSATSKRVPSDSALSLSVRRSACHPSDHRLSRVLPRCVRGGPPAPHNIYKLGCDRMVSGMYLSDAPAAMDSRSMHRSYISAHRQPQ